MTIQPAFPSAPNRTAKHELRFTRGGEQCALLLFAATYAARKMIEQVAGDDGLKWISSKQAQVGENIRILAPDLEEIMEYEYSKEEDAWRLPEPYPTHALRIRGEAYKPAHTPGDTSSDADTSKRTSKPARAPKPARERKPRANVEGLVQLGDISASINLDAKQARGILRKHATKPEHGAWAWPEAEVEAIKALLEKHRK